MNTQAQLPCAQCAQRPIGLPAGLDRAQLEEFESGKTNQKLRVGQTLFCEGAPSLSIHCVRAGVFKLFKVGVGGEPLVLRFCGPGTALGVRSALAGETHEDTAEAIEDATVCTFPREVLATFVHKSPAMALAVMRQFAIEVREAHERMMELAHCAVLQRAAHLLLELHASRGRVGASGSTVGVPVRRMDMAAMIGTSPESMSRVLHQLRERGILEVGPEGVRVLDESRLRAIARMPAEREPV